MHKDGVTFTTLFCVDRHNINGGVNLIYDNQKNLIEETTLRNCGDMVIMTDNELYHDVSPVTAAASTGGKRDMLFIEFTEIS